MKRISLFTLLCFASLIHAADLAISNVRGYTMDSDGNLVKFSSLLVDNGKVAALNPDKNAISKARLKIDGKNQVMLPGLIDAHGHLLGLGDELRLVNLRGTVSEADAVARVNGRLGESLGSNWLLGRGWNQELWSSRDFPTKSSLDDLSGSLPIWLLRIDNHAGWANSKALELAGITRDTPDPAGGKIIKDENGEPTGVLIDKAMGLINQVLPSVGTDIMEQQLQLAADHLLAQGITSMHDAGVNRATYDFYLKKAVDNTLPLRIYAMLAVTDPQIDAMLGNGHIYDAEDMLHIRSVKVYGDGALGSRGAAMLNPYSDREDETGLLLTAEDAMIPMFTKLISMGYQINYHAIGDKANRLALDTFETVFKEHGGSRLRHRVEHAQVIDVNDLARFPQLGVLPSMQPTHATSDMNMAEDRVGRNRIKGAYAWQTLLKLGARIPLGSDFPVELANPFYGIHAAVTRKDRNNQPQTGWYPEQALTIEQAFDGFTRTAAYSGHMEDKVGQLQPGFWADFILVDQDPFAISPDDLWKIGVNSTWIAGELRFTK